MLNWSGKIYFLACFLLLISCKKEKDEKGPVITFITPFDNQGFGVYDVVHVKAEIKDETKISNVGVTLVDANYSPMQASIQVNISSPSGIVNVDYEINNIHLESGLYYMMITASDGNNDSHEYQPINIAAIPRMLKRVFVATKPNSSLVNLFYIDSSFSAMNLYHTFSSDFLGMSVSSYYQQAFLCGNYTGDYTSLSLKDNTIKFIVPAFISSSPSFTAYYNEDKVNYIAGFDGTVKGYNNSGLVTYNATANSNYYVSNLMMNHGFLIAEEISKTNGPRILVSFHSTGVPEQQRTITQDIVSFCEKDDHSVFLFGNNSGQAVIQLYDRLNNNLWNPYPSALPTGSILSALRLDEDTYLLGHSNGIIYKYQYQNSSLTPFLPGYTALKLKYDTLNNSIYIAEQNRITCVSVFGGSVLNSIASAQDIKDFDLLYNR
ncbi:MAG: hypothetical protein K0Q95_3092 [Bacteroidota bacterium]|jgi:hypothetical protein|nr:hypothetical protein [Bacteroidota bacterium]